MDSAILPSCATSCEDTGSRQISPLFPGIGDAPLLLPASSSVMGQDYSPYQFMAVTTLQASLERLRLRSCIPELSWLVPECEIMKHGRASNTIPLWSSRRALSPLHVPKFSSATAILRQSIPR